MSKKPTYTFGKASSTKNIQGVKILERVCAAFSNP
jgi:hypothetical protein